MNFSYDNETAFENISTGTLFVDSMNHSYAVCMKITEITDKSNETYNSFDTETGEYFYTEEDTPIEFYKYNEIIEL